MSALPPEADITETAVMSAKCQHDKAAIHNVASYPI